MIGSGYLVAWIDGVEQSLAATGLNAPSSSEEIYVGIGDDGGGSGGTTLYLDEVAYTNAALSEETITALYNSGTGQRYDEAGLL